MIKKSVHPWVNLSKPPAPFHYKNAASFYASTPWRNLRAFKLIESPLCEDHLIIELMIPAEEVDHIKEIADYPELALEITNLRSLCKTCHSKKSIKHFNDSRRPKRGGIVTFKTKYLNNDKTSQTPGTPPGTDKDPRGLR